MSSSVLYLGRISTNAKRLRKGSLYRLNLDDTETRHRYIPLVYASQQASDDAFAPTAGEPVRESGCSEGRDVVSKSRSPTIVSPDGAHRPSIADLEEVQSIEDALLDDQEGSDCTEGTVLAATSSEYVNIPISEHELLESSGLRDIGKRPKLPRATNAMLEVKKQRRLSATSGSTLVLTSNIIGRGLAMLMVEGQLNR